jgi:uncharacterized RDD family membrane protein YckC
VTTPSLPGEPDGTREEAQQALDDLYTKPRQDEVGQTAYAAVPPPLPSAQQPSQGSPQDSPQPPPAQSPGAPPYPPYPQSYPQQPPYSNGPYGPPPGGQFGPGYGYGRQMPGMPGMPAGMPPFAGWWQRAGAWLLDNVLIGLALSLIVSWSRSDALETLTGIIALAWAIYNAWRAGATGQSYGKRAVGIRLAQLSDGKPVGGGYGLLRLLMNAVFSALCFIPGLLNYLWPLWDEKHQTWSDKIAGSVVVKA